MLDCSRTNMAEKTTNYPQPSFVKNFKKDVENRLKTMRVLTSGLNTAFKTNIWHIKNAAERRNALARCSWEHKCQMINIEASELAYKVTVDQMMKESQSTPEYVNLSPATQQVTPPVKSTNVEHVLLSNRRNR